MTRPDFDDADKKPSSPVDEDSINNLSDPDTDASVQETGEDNDFERDGRN